jgi:hypothetical protein
VPAGGEQGRERAPHRSVRGVLSALVDHTALHLETSRDIVVQLGANVDVSGNTALKVACDRSDGAVAARSRSRPEN